MKGQAYNIDRYKQVIDYSGMLYERGITPTDIDGLMDFGGKFFAIIELKFLNAELPFGQRLCLERVCDGLAERHECAVFVARHSLPPELHIPAAECSVSEYRWKGQWRIPAQSISLRQAVDIIKRRVEESERTDLTTATL
jgi:hypothetical protein